MNTKRYSNLSESRTCKNRPNKKLKEVHSGKKKPWKDMGRYWTCETEISSSKEEPTKNVT